MTALTIDDLLEVRDSPVHGLGVFARQPISAGTRLIEYAGERIDKQESTRRCEEGNVFILAVDENWDIDGAVGENPARWINHSCEPNCEALIDEGDSEGGDGVSMGGSPVGVGGVVLAGAVAGARVFIEAAREIAAGEEITFNYGYDLEDCRDYPCRCGAPSCVGYIVAEEFFPQVRRLKALAAEAGGSGTRPQQERPGGL